MRVLLTNIRLEMRAGSELYLLDVARWLRDHGHEPVAYSARLGSFADEIRAEGIATIDDLRLVAEPPDVIHGQHHLAIMTAIARFPDVPVVAYCHGWTPWEEVPIEHPSIRRYVAVSDHTRQRITLESGIDPLLVSVIPNFVDTNRFVTRTQLPVRPQRALIFSNYAARGSAWVEVVAAACAARGIDLTVAGAGWGAVTDRPEEYLHEFDLVFAKARAAIEAMATGAAVILCDATGVGPLVTPENFAALREGNFGMRVLRQPHEQPLVEAAIDGYDPASAAAVAELVLGSLARDSVVPEIVALYEEAIADAKKAPTDERVAVAAMAAYLEQLNRLNPAPADEISAPFTRQLEIAERLRVDAQADHQKQLGALLDELESVKRRHDGELTAAHEQRDRRQQEASDLRDQLLRSAAELESMRSSTSDLRDQLLQSTVELESMRNSTSWRVTEPLRSIGRLARSMTRGRGAERP